MGTTNRVPQQRIGEPEPAVDVARPEEASRLSRRVAFDRLLSVAVLTPAQAALVAVQLLDAAVPAGPPPGDDAPSARLGAVTLAPSGELDVAHPDGGEDTELDELLDRLLQNARRLPAHPKPEQLRLLRRLEEVVGDRRCEPGVRARELESALTDSLGPGARTRVTGQLAALVEAFAHLAGGVLTAREPGRGPRPVSPAITQAVPSGSAPPPPPSSAPRRSAPDQPPSSRPARSGRALLRRRARRQRATILVLVLAAVLAVGGYVVLRGSGLGFLGSNGGSAQPSAPGTTAPARPSRQSAQHPGAHVRAVPALAARHAGRVTGVVVQRTGRCRPGALCPVRVTVHLRPASTSQQVTWRVAAARLCRHGISWSPPRTVTARAGWTTVYAGSSVRVPRGRSLALVAVTSAPAHAQSRPVPVTGSSLRC